MIALFPEFHPSLQIQGVHCLSTPATDSPEPNYYFHGVSTLRYTPLQSCPFPPQRPAGCASCELTSHFLLHFNPARSINNSTLLSLPHAFPRSVFTVIRSVPCWVAASRPNSAPTGIRSLIRAHNMVTRPCPYPRHEHIPLGRVFVCSNKGCSGWFILQSRLPTIGGSGVRTASNLDQNHPQHQLG